MDEKMGFLDGYPLIVVFYRGFFCPRDNTQLRSLVDFQSELAVNYCKLVTISTDSPKVSAAFKAGLAANWPFLSDENREAVERLGILDETEGEYAYTARPFTFVLRPDLTVHKAYDGWFFVGRPTVEELRRDLRDILSKHANYTYEAFDTLEAKSIRIPQQEWANGAPPLGSNGLPVARGQVKSFDIASGNGEISPDDRNESVFFNFTAIPGEGYRTISPGASVEFETVEHSTGLIARNVREI